MPFLRKATDNPFGYRPDQYPIQITEYAHDASAAIKYPGDLCILEADGASEIASTGSANIIGAAVGYTATGTATTVLIYDHPLQRFVAQDDGDTGIMTATSLGSRCNIVTTTGDTTTRQSKQEIDSSTAATTSTNAVSIIALHPIEGGSYATTTGQQRKWICSLNNHLFGFAQQAGI